MVSLQRNRLPHSGRSLFTKDHGDRHTDTLKPDRLQSGFAMTTLIIVCQDIGEKYVRSRKKKWKRNFSGETWNVGTLRPGGKFEQLTLELNRYHLTMLGLCQMR